MDPWLAKLVLASGFSVYVIIGGYVAVVWTDTIQAVVLFFGFMLMAFFAVSEVGGLSELGSLTGTQLDFLRGDKLLPSISLMVAIAIGVLGVPSFRQRIYSADSVSTVRKTFYLTTVLYFLFCSSDNNYTNMTSKRLQHCIIMASQQPQIEFNMTSH